MYAGSTVTVVFVRIGLSVYAGSTVTDDLCQDWSVGVCWRYSDTWFVSGSVCQCMLVVQWLVVCVRTGLSVYAGSTVAGGLCQDWSVSVCW